MSVPGASSRRLLPPSNIIATLEPPPNDTSNNVLGVWLGSGAHNAGAAIGVYPTPRAHKDRIAVEGVFPTEHVKGMAVFRGVVALKTDSMRKVG